MTRRSGGIVVLWLSCLWLGLACGSPVQDPDPTTTSNRTEMATPGHPSERPPTELAGIATEFALGGAFKTTDEAESMVGYRLLRPEPALLAEVPATRQGGLVDVFPEIGLPRVRQGYILLGKRDNLGFTQEPATYPAPPRHGRVSQQRFGEFDGELTEDGDNVAFRFLTGESIEGVSIRGVVGTLQGYAPSDIQRFVESLSFQ